MTFSLLVQSLSFTISGCVLIVAASLIAFLMLNLKKVQAKIDLLDSSLRNETKLLEQSIASDEEEAVEYDAENSGLIKTTKNYSIEDFTNRVETQDETNTKKKIRFVIFFYILSTYDLETLSEIDLDLDKKQSFANAATDIKNHVEKTVVKKLVLIIIICAIFMISEIIGGYLANSLSIICDAFHLLSDLGGFIISLFSTFLSTRKPSMRMNFGYRRIEVLGAFSSIIIIWLLTCALLYIAVMRIVNGDYEIDAKIMTTMASIAVCFNLIMAFILSYTHSHKEISSQKRNSIFIPPKIIDSKQSLGLNRFSVGKIDSLNIPSENDKSNLGIDNDQINSMVSRNINIRAAFIHIIGDIIQSLGVLIAALVIFFEPCWKIADPICTISFSIIVLVTTVPIVTDIVAILLESFPKQVDYDELVKTVVSHDGVKCIYDLKCWYIIDMPKFENSNRQHLLEVTFKSELDSFSGLIGSSMLKLKNDMNKMKKDQPSFPQSVDIQPLCICSWFNTGKN
ncbi:zinc transporter 2-like [Brachionus plicatilis]|uniref:Zinc transporter 2-like n=1 Tax=Brachionus plicatilis TaxID=10195 RepID=A0A3M7SNI6_BRAPC|nr:zinc transporter 2-like [Brachionus plicatilis]